MMACGATQSTNTVKFNGTTASPTSWGASSITVPVPAGATSGNAVVTVAGGPSNGVSFTVPPPPSLSQLTPTSGPLGTPISLTGSNFGSTQGSSQVRVSGVAATVTSWGGNSITATIPNGVTTGQALPVTVVTSAGTSNALGFTASTPPNVTGVVINPHMASMVVGETRTLQATDPSGVVVPGLLWLSGDNNVVSLSTTTLL